MGAHAADLLGRVGRRRLRDTCRESASSAASTRSRVTSGGATGVADRLALAIVGGRSPTPRRMLGDDSACRRWSGTARAASPGRAPAAARRSPADRACRCGRCAARRARRRTRATTSCEVGPSGLSMTRRPSGTAATLTRSVLSRALSAPRLRLAAQAQRADVERARRAAGGRTRHRRRRVKPGGVAVAAAAELRRDQADVEIALRAQADAHLAARLRRAPAPPPGSPPPSAAC